MTTKNTNEIHKIGLYPSNGDVF